MSNPDYAGPYWQDQAGAGSGGRGRRHGPARRRSRRSRGGAVPTAKDLRGRPGLRAEAGYGGARPANGRAPGGKRAGYPAGRGGTLIQDRPADLPGHGRPPPGRRRGGGGGRGGARRGTWWRRWTWKKALAVLTASALLLVLAAAAGFIYLYDRTPIPTDVSEAALQESSTVYFSNGKEVVGTFAGGVNRQLLTFRQIPADMRDAIIAAEDRNFYTEGGISVTGILRAGYEDLFGRGGLQGGSTITEQFAKNYYATIGASRSVKTKLKEIIVAIKLAHEKSKDWILTNYLNTVYFGGNAYGVGAAAETYFNEPAKDLTVAQAAMLAAMVNEPGYFSPRPGAGRPYTALVARWRYVLGNMVRDGALSPAAARAEKFPKVAPGPVSYGWTGWRGYIMQAVQDELQSRYGYTVQQLDSDGLRIVTTFSERMMRELYQSVREVKQTMRADGRPLPWWAHIGAVLEQPGTGAILAMYAGPGYNARHCKLLKCQFNTALQARNQVGSSFKPYVLATAVKQGMNAQSSVLDGYASICSPSDAFPLKPSITVRGSTCPNSPYGWYNFQSIGESNGPVSVATASALSLNTAYGDLIHRVGTENVIQMAKAFGVNTRRYPIGSSLQAMRGQSGIALGQASLTVEEQATTFAALADDGMYHTPHVIAKITQGGNSIRLNLPTREVLNPNQAADVDWALSFDTIYGTAYPNAVLNPVRPTIAKTGTTNFAQDAFFIGAIPQYSLAIGMYTNNQDQRPGGQTLNQLPAINGQAGGYGGAWPAWLWHTYMTNEFAKLPVKPLPPANFAGFGRWVQVPPVKPKPRHHPHPGPSPTCWPRHHHFWPQLCKSPGPGPGPTPTCTPAPPGGCPTPRPRPSPSPPPAPPRQSPAHLLASPALGGPATAAKQYRPGVFRAALSLLLSLL